MTPPKKTETPVLFTVLTTTRGTNGRREMFAEDRSLLLDNEPEKLWPWAILDEDKNMLTRPVPTLFTVYKV